MPDSFVQTPLESKLVSSESPCMPKPPAETQLSVSLVREFLRDQHPCFAHLPLTEGTSGWDNDIFRLGEELAVRLPRRQAAVALLENEQRWLPQLQPRLPLRVPAPIAVGQAAGRFSLEMEHHALVRRRDAGSVVAGCGSGRGPGGLSRRAAHARACRGALQSLAQYAAAAAAAVPLIGCVQALAGGEWAVDGALLKSGKRR